MQKFGMSTQADLRLQDYRDIGVTTNDAPFDAIVSIEMIEAVGQAYWPEYFKTIHRLLKPNVKVCIQSIVIDDALFDRYVGSTDFIQQYIFPGGCLPCPREFKRQANLAGFKVFDERFIRIWEFYLAYCEAAFAKKNTDVVQFTLQKI
jgi:cyclopropane-fatty-acyl-phospholipid synthase